MTLDAKTTWVADVLYGTTGLSPLEKRLISTQAFNRLHNVLQNSTVYFTYPSNRTSRFSHSLGVAKLAGDMFRNGILNAPSKLRHLFLDTCGKRLRAFTSDIAFLRQRTILRDLRPEHETSWRFESINCNLYESMLIPGLSDEHAYIYTVLFQSVRFAALLHDLGHPPFSHVSEFALRNVYDRVKENIEQTRGNNSSARVAEKEYELANQLDEFLSEAHEDAAFHEVLGYQLAESLLETLFEDLREARHDVHQCFAMLQIHFSTLRILQKSEDGLFAGIHNIVSSDLEPV